MFKNSLLLIASLIISSSAVAASYEVPVDGTEESKFSNFEIKDFRMDRDGKTMAMSYILPLEVTGLENLVALSGDLDGSNIVKLKGENALATCKLAESTCSIRYRDLKIDRGLIESRLKDLNLNPAEIAARLSVADQFRADPIGFLKFP